MYQLIYGSSATENLDWEDVRDLAKIAADKNKVNNITGCLIYGNNSFIQILEGKSNAINSLYLEIAQDTRHKDVRLLDYSKISAKSFSSWSMGCVLANAQNEVKNVAQEYFRSDTIYPYDLSPESARLFMIEIAQYYKE